MKLKTFYELIKTGQIGLMLAFSKSASEFYRLSFIHAGISSGIFDILKDGPKSAEEVAAAMGDGVDARGVEAWLDLGVSLKELGLSKKKYAIKSKATRKIIEPEFDAYRAILEEGVIHHHKYILETPGMLKAKKRFEFDESVGELIARSSRISEPYIREVMDDVIPRKGPFSMLEVGCGAGAYIKYACELNPSLTATGLELQPEVAQFARGNIEKWGLLDRVEIIASDVRKYSSEKKFDLVTLHQNIYYFKEEEREGLVRSLSEFIRPGGRLLITTACRGGSPFTRMLDIWVTVTEHHDPLPEAGQLMEIIKRTGYSEVRKINMIPGEAFHAFIAKNPQ